MFTSEFVIEGLHCDACTKLVGNRIKKKIEEVVETEIEVDGHTKIVAGREISKQELADVLLGTDYSIQ